MEIFKLSYIALYLGIITISYIWLLTKSDVKNYIKVLCIPALAIGWIYVPWSLIDLMGRPTTAELPEEFYVKDFLVVEKTGKKSVYIWIVKDLKDMIPYTYEMPYTKAEHKELEKQRKTMQKHGVVKGRRVLPSESPYRDENNDPIKPPFELKAVEPDEILKKE